MNHYPLEAPLSRPAPPPPPLGIPCFKSLVLDTQGRLASYINFGEPPLLNAAHQASSGRAQLTPENRRSSAIASQASHRHCRRRPRQRRAKPATGRVLPQAPWSKARPSSEAATRTALGQKHINTANFNHDYQYGQRTTPTKSDSAWVYPGTKPGRYPG